MKLYRTLIAAIASLLFISAGVSFAQDDFSYPNTNWPYLYRDFTPGIIHLTDGKNMEADINVCIDGSLHYLDEKGTILESVTKNVLTCKIGNDIYVNVGKGMMLILEGDTDPLVLKVVEIDESERDQSEIGYGMKSSTYASSSVDIASINTFYGNALLHAQVAEKAMDRQYGEKIPVKESYLIRSGINLIKATKSDFVNFVGKDKANPFLKANKIKWSDPKSIMKVAEFISKQ